MKKELKLPLRVALMVSGGGTTAWSLIKRFDPTEQDEVVPVCLIASRVGISAIEKVSRIFTSTKIHVCDPKDFSGPDEFGAELLRIFEKHDVNLFGQYGWLPKTPSNVIDAYWGINQHPGPLPCFGGKGMYGIRVHAAVCNFRNLTGREIYTEATSQWVEPEFDAGKVLIRSPVKVRSDDTPETLQSRVLAVEHETQHATLLQLVWATQRGEEFPEELSQRDLRGGFHLVADHDALEVAKELAIEKYP